MRRRLHSTEPGKMLRSECGPIRSHPGDVGCNGGMQTGSGSIGRAYHWTAVRDGL